PEWGAVNSTADAASGTPRNGTCATGRAYPVCSASLPPGPSTRPRAASCGRSDSARPATTWATGWSVLSCTDRRVLVVFSAAAPLLPALRGFARCSRPEGLLVEPLGGGSHSRGLGTVARY